MKKYKLKKGYPAFQIVDGPMRGHKFEPGREYSKIPAGEEHRFTGIDKKRGKK